MMQDQCCKSKRARLVMIEALLMPERAGGKAGEESLYPCTDQPTFCLLKANTSYRHDTVVQ